ncbi:hypothetical protein GCG54_00004887 [Colletotrichum gloeosporioides]|uniref:Uncharacterized protein n=1 Tax=Colletotrichum gloeosporioides TaxID=474922 RepID=A0A8H4CGR9_COLGL|nr:uncharacterized protein GCG54_00004887 [Colletotrichum gloeosporioides]KAF3803710.1 hypothetical protein GCG54_00004887 [Colletotrichum gloeosporioides]
MLLTTILCAIGRCFLRLDAVLAILRVLGAFGMVSCLLILAFCHRAFGKYVLALVALSPLVRLIQTSWEFMTGDFPWDNKGYFVSSREGEFLPWVVFFQLLALGVLAVSGRDYIQRILRKRQEGQIDDLVEIIMTDALEASEETWEMVEYTEGSIENGWAGKRLASHGNSITTRAELETRQSFGEQEESLEEFFGSISWAHGCSAADQKAEKLTRERSSSLPPPSHESEDEVATPMAVTPGSQQTRSTDLVNHKSELSSSPPRKWLQLDDMISGPRLVQVKPGPGYDDLPPLTYVTTDPGVVDSIPPLDAATQALALDDLRDHVSSSCSSSRASRSPSPEREEIIEKDDWETDDEDQVTEDEDDETESELEWVQRVETREPGRMVRLLNGKCIPHSKWKKKHKHGRKSNWGMVLIVSMLVVLLALFVAYIMNLAWCEGIAGRT